jgi:hypothetical protein
MAGAACIAWQAAHGNTIHSGWRGIVGVLGAVGALASWTAFAVGNSRQMARLGAISAHDWNLMMGVVTGAGPAADPGGAVGGVIPPWRGRMAALWRGLRHGGVAGLDRGQCLVEPDEPVAAPHPGGADDPVRNAVRPALWLCVEGRWPTVMECAAFALLIAGVSSCLAAHRPMRRAHA